MPSTPSRGYTYPATSSPATVPADLRVPLEQVDADVQTLVDEFAAKVGLNPDGTAPPALEAQIQQIAQENGTPPGSIPIFATLAEAEAWMSANPGRTALTTEAPADPGAWVATAPSFSTGDRTYTIPTDAGATYQVDGITVEAGTYQVGAEAVTITVQAVARAGYTLAEPTSWSQAYAVLPPKSIADLVTEDSADTHVHVVSGAFVDDGAAPQSWTATDVAFSGDVATFNGSTSSVVGSVAGGGVLGATAATVIVVGTPTSGTAWSHNANRLDPVDAQSRVYGTARAGVPKAVASPGGTSPAGQRAMQSWTYSSTAFAVGRNGTTIGTTAGGAVMDTGAAAPYIGSNIGSTGFYSGTIEHVIIIRGRVLSDARLGEYANAAGVL